MGSERRMRKERAGDAAMLGKLMSVVECKIRWVRRYHETIDDVGHRD
jgi:hypothetical protein